ncbi:hypothetical protein HGRIS_005699 [Hohenbuehelia grisea]|uniref:Uncharacterized protein n=1 Tax=Hohenbuehelia grisea TaxID=104357 RepID=A0ABR3JZQ7_9AGAR
MQYSTIFLALPVVSTDRALVLAGEAAPPTTTTKVFHQSAAASVRGAWNDLVHLKKRRALARNARRQAERYLGASEEDFAAMFPDMKRYL